MGAALLPFVAIYETYRVLPEEDLAWYQKWLSWGKDREVSGTDADEGAKIAKFVHGQAIGGTAVGACFAAFLIAFEGFRQRQKGWWRHLRIVLPVVAAAGLIASKIVTGYEGAYDGLFQRVGFIALIFWQLWLVHHPEPK